MLEITAFPLINTPATESSNNSVSFVVAKDNEDDEDEDAVVDVDVIGAVVVAAIVFVEYVGLWTNFNQMLIISSTQ